ncbi:hypothetical protein V6N13_106948 [Hibiscus sabdariffa]
MNTSVAGIYGYIAPEKSFDAPQSWHLIQYANESLSQGTIYHAIDPHLKGRIAPECLDKYLEIAFSCVHLTGNERAAMGEVEVTLELALELQDRADAEMQATNPCGEYMYEEVLFSAFPRKFTGLDIPYDPFHFSDSDDNNSTNNS